MVVEPACRAGREVSGAVARQPGVQARTCGGRADQEEVRLWLRQINDQLTDMDDVVD